MQRRIDFDMYAPPVKEKPAAGLLAGSTKALLSEDEALESVIQLVAPGETIVWDSNGNWSMHQLLLSLLNITGPGTVHISSYAMSETAARVLATLKRDGMIERLSCVLDNRVDVRTPGSLQLIRAVCDEFALIKTHAKVTVITNADWSLAVIGSANYTENIRHEAGVIIATAAVANKQINWIKKGLQDAAN